MKSWIGIPESSDGWRFAKVLTWLMPSSSFPALVEQGADKKDPKMIPLMDEILAPPGMVKTWDNYHPWWCRILSINSTMVNLGGGSNFV